MLWLIMWISVALFAVNLVQFVEWGFQYINVEILHRAGTVLHNFGQYGIYAVFFLAVTVICIIFLEKIKKRAYTIVSKTEKYEIIKCVDKSTLLKGRFYAVTYKKENGELIYIECPETVTKVYLLDEEKPYILITSGIHKTPSKVEEVLTIYSHKFENYEIRIRP